MAENVNTGRAKSYDSFDLFKFIVSFVVMTIHLNPLGESNFHYLHPWSRIAIPVYFMISAFLFFSKYDSLPDGEKNSYLLKFIKRDLILYLFWFIVFLPFTVIYRDYLHKGIAFFIGSILFGSTFPASWYLIALVIAIVIVAKCDKGIGKYIIPVIGILFFLLCTGQFTWRPIADKTVFLPKIYNATEIIYANNFTIAIIWIWFGRRFAQYRDRLLAMNMKKVLAAFAASVVLLFAEHEWLFRQGWFTKHNDVYLSLILAGPLLFLIILKLEIHVSNAKFLRNMSTLVYCFHASFGECLRVYVFTPKFGGYEAPWSVLCFLITAACTLLVGWLILKYSDKVKFLKNAY